MGKRYLSIAMVLCMIVCMMPMMAFAEGETPDYAEPIPVNDYDSLYNVLKDSESATAIPVAKLAGNITVPNDKEICTLGKIIVPDGYTLTIEGILEAEVEIEVGGTVTVDDKALLCTTMGADIVNAGTLEVKERAQIRTWKGGKVINKSTGDFLLEGAFQCGSHHYDGVDNLWFDNKAAAGKVTGGGVIVLYDAGYGGTGSNVNMDSMIEKVMDLLHYTSRFKDEDADKIQIGKHEPAGNYDELKEILTKERRIKDELAEGNGDIIVQLVGDVTVPEGEELRTMGAIQTAGNRLFIEGVLEASILINPGGHVIVEPFGELYTTMGGGIINNGDLQVSYSATLTSQKGGPIINDGDFTLDGICYVGSYYKDASENDVWIEAQSGSHISGQGIIVLNPVEAVDGAEDDVATRIAMTNELKTAVEGSVCRVPIFTTARDMAEVKALNASSDIAGIYLNGAEENGIHTMKLSDESKKTAPEILLTEDLTLDKPLCVDWCDVIVTDGKTLTIPDLSELYFSGRRTRIMAGANDGTINVAGTNVISGDASKNAILTAKSNRVALGAAQWAMDSYPVKASYEYLGHQYGAWYYVHDENGDPGVADAKGPMPQDAALPLLVDGTLNITGDFTYDSAYVEFRNKVNKAENVNAAISTIVYCVGSEENALRGVNETEFGLEFDLNTGNGYSDIYDHLSYADGSKIYLQSELVTLNNGIPVTPERSGYTFNGWKATSDWSNATAEKLATFTIENDQYGWYVHEPAEFPVRMVAQWTRNSSSSSKNNNETATSAVTPGTTTETKADGTAVTTTVNADGIKAVTAKSADGISQTVKTDAAGNMTEATATVPQEAIEAAIEAAKTEAGQDVTPMVTLPTEVKAAGTAETAAKVNINLPASVSKENPAKVEIPVENLTAGTVAILVNPDGTETIIKAGELTEEGLAIELTGDVTIKIVDNTKEFSDVAKDNWASNSIQFVAARGIFNGTGGGNFAPEETMSRGMLAKAFCNFADGNEVQNGTFGDAAGKWYEGAANWAAELGIMNGSGNDFNGDAPIDREQLATSYYRLALAQGKVKTAAKGADIAGFGDAAAISDFAKEAVAWCVGAGLMNGMGGNINPKGLATRAQVSAMMQRYCAL